MADGSLARLFWRVVDVLDYWLMQARLGIVDAVCGPDPPTPADEKRERIATGRFGVDATTAVVEE